MDLINRQAAIDVIIKDKICDNTLKIMTALGDGDKAETLNMTCDRHAKMLMSLPPAQPEQKWIPVTELLPKEKDAGILNRLGIEKRSEYVLATVEVKGKKMAVTACTYDGVWHWDKKYAFPDFKVIAWMPLPESYQGEDE